MSTVNFDDRDASKIFVCELENEFDYDDAISNIQSALEEKFKDSYLEKDHHDRDSRELRSYPSRMIAEISGQGKFYYVLQEDIFPVLDIVAIGGYYEHMNIDYNIKFNVAGYTVESLDEIDAQYLMYGTDLSEKQALRYVEWSKKFLQKALETLRDEVEEIFEQYTTPIRCVAVASNGEAFYERAG